MIHQFACVHPDARIGENAVIEPFVNIAGDVVIGDGTHVMSNAVIMDGSRIGKNCKIFPGAVIAGIPQDLKFEGEYTTVEIGDNTTIRECVTVNRGTKAKNKTVVGSNCLLMAYAHVAHDVKIGDNCVLVSHTGIAGEVEIGDWVIISGGTLVQQFVRIGDHAMIGGACSVRKDVPPYVRAARDPMTYVGVNSVGLRRRGFTNEKIWEIQDIYRELYQKDMNHSEALKYIEENYPPCEERDNIVNFVRSSKRGIMKGAASGSEKGDDD
jgi:UDP-N-acetylglucosamine acyltransferase